MAAAVAADVVDNPKQQHSVGQLHLELKNNLAVWPVLVKFRHFGKSICPFIEGLFGIWQKCAPTTFV